MTTTENQSKPVTEPETEITEIKSKPVKRTIQIHNFMKVFTNFKQGCEEVFSVLPYIKDICGSFLTPEAVRSKLLDIVKEDIPYPSNSKYPDTLSISVDAHEFSIKLTNRVAFGCRTSFSSSTSSVFHSFRISYIATINPDTSSKEYKEKEEQMAKLKSLGWKEVNSVIQSNFWDKVEGKEKRTRRDKKFLNTNKQNKKEEYKHTTTKTKESATDKPKQKYHKPFIKKDSNHTNTKLHNNKSSFTKPKKEYNNKPEHKRTTTKTNTSTVKSISSKPSFAKQHREDNKNNKMNHNKPQNRSFNKKDGSRSNNNRPNSKYKNMNKDNRNKQQRVKKSNNDSIVYSENKKEAFNPVFDKNLLNLNKK